jgi:isoaspartyl peptidase/L-asparaginase-like protein (Ntn-hydrolase superfamily)
MKIVMAKTAAEMLRNGSSQDAAANECIQLLARRTHATGGLILLDRAGRPAAAFNTPSMAHGYLQPDGSVFISL